MIGTCNLCGAAAPIQIGAKASPSWGTFCEPIQLFACEAHFDEIWAEINADFTATQPRVIAEKRRKIRVLADPV